MRRRCIESAYGTLTAMMLSPKNFDMHISIIQFKKQVDKKESRTGYRIGVEVIGTCSDTASSPQYKLQRFVTHRTLRGC